MLQTRFLHSKSKPPTPLSMVLHFAASITCGHPGFKNIKWKIPEIRVSFVAQLVKNLPAMWETWVPSLGWEDPLEKALPYSSLEYSMDCIVHGVTKSGTRLSDFHFQK